MAKRAQRHKWMAETCGSPLTVRNRHFSGVANLARLLHLEESGSPIVPPTLVELQLVDLWSSPLKLQFELIVQEGEALCVACCELKREHCIVGCLCVSIFSLANASLL
ncbi:hypothetical protein GOP47_0024586 [Adiantum capillus-veneris]|uniref:Uncharacterized protein n=1 Tax=Adiantum capillus-veneris TaxID=13818 RepID=A0A9D4U4R1_ADICA|nr:hypothetical protein GOP47_0024586 [Adiantum capillus-veneris]